MRKFVLGTVATLAVLCGSSGAIAQTTITGTVSSGYVFDNMGIVASKRPVANIDWNFQHGDSCLSTNLWAQASEEPRRATEIDLTETCTRTFGKIQAHIVAGGYFYPAGAGKSDYTVGAGMSWPMGPLNANAEVQTYTGGFRSTRTTLSLDGTLPLASSFKPTVTVGRSWNDNRGFADKNLWFGRISDSFGSGKYPVTIGLRGFVTDTGETGSVIDFSIRH